jgi:hypothetical protein
LLETIGIHLVLGSHIWSYYKEGSWIALLNQRFQPPNPKK